MSVVLDASMAITWLFDDEATERTKQTQALVEAHGANVPSLWRLEVANAMQFAVRRGRCDTDYADQSLSRLARLQIAVDPDTDVRAWTATLTLARAQNLTVYDAAYLELALRLNLAVASCDAALNSAARRCGVEVIGP